MSQGPAAQELRNRLDRAAAAATSKNLAAILVTPGDDMTYLCGYEALPLERLTCLVVPATGDPVIVVPQLEVLAAEASPVGELGIEIRSWSETSDPHELVARSIAGGAVGAVAVNPQMWAAHLVAFEAAMPSAQMVIDSAVSELRMRKSHWEEQALREAGAAIDWVHTQVPALLRPGRAEREVAKDISELILASGHSTVDFVIVASGPNGASPHHDVSDRVLEVGDPIVVDIGGTMPSGYCSDCTRTYALGDPGEEYLQAYASLQAAQAAAVAHVRPGVTCESVDAAARDRLGDDGLAEAFVHRTGHGIGMSTHEDPYIVAGNTREVETGFAFSVEPGFYFPGRYGARIEDIVVVAESGATPCNTLSHDLVIVASD